ncbi:MAG: hypothetical protein K8J31_26925, partial [Anaerolineae bacterium]|nr:hypothetical protein [Anaerolineae bacterium]
YAQALLMLEKAQMIGKQSADEELLEHIDLEKARIFLESGNITDALFLIKDRKVEDQEILALLGEASVIAGNLDDARLFVEQAISAAEAAPEHFLVLGRLYSNLGRIYAMNGQGDEAQTMLSAAITWLEQTPDLYGLGRAKSVLAAALIKDRHDYHEVHRLLRDAQEIQVEIADRTGLVYTRRNLEELKRRYAVDGKEVWTTM